MNDACTYCGTGGEALVVHRQGIFADEWYPEETPWSVVRPGVPACRICANDVRVVQLRLWWMWSSSCGWAVDPLDVEVMTRRLVRALYRWETGEPLPLDVQIGSAQLSSEKPSKLLEAIASQGLDRRELRPGIVYWFARVSDCDYGSIWYVAIWSRIFLFAKTLGRREGEVGDE